jgi:hypothetical protein
LVVTVGSTTTLVAALAMAVGGCGGGVGSQAAPDGATPSFAQAGGGGATDSAGHQASRGASSQAVATDQSVDSLGRPAPPEPDRALTPGATLAVSAQDVCAPGYSRKVRDVPREVKRAVYASYGIAARAPGEYEVDHLISLGIGGSNSVRNLWPQANWTSPWNARVKDALENRLHRDVCAGRVDLQTAQRDMATDWIAAYQRYFQRAVPKTRKAISY